MKKSVLCVIVPCYNEQEVLQETNIRLNKVLDRIKSENSISEESYICYVSDGSIDQTWEILEELTAKSKRIKAIKLARNYGHQNAVYAGLVSCKADVFITIDADLQDDENVMSEMVDHYNNGSHVVYGVRRKRKEDTFFKKWTAQLFYVFMKRMGVDLIYNHADFRLMSSVIVEHLKKFEEVHLFLRALVTQIGYKSSVVYYDRSARFAGKTKYPLKKMFSFAWNGVTSFTAFPLKMITYLGMISFFIALLGVVYVLVSKYFGETNPGWSSTVFIIIMFSSMQLFSLGILGEYVARIYDEVKSRPRFIVEKEI